MNVTLDTNVIVRLLVLDDPVQVALAVNLLAEASTAIATSASLCEVAWVLRSHYRLPAAAIRTALAKFAALPGIVTNREHVDAGLAFLDGGADFADGVIAAEGRALGGEILISFDKRAVAVAARLGFGGRAP